MKDASAFSVTMKFLLFLIVGLSAGFVAVNGNGAAPKGPKVTDKVF